ncbi:helix-turn-helix domain-containing protein [Deinococcus metalli]
MTQSSRPNSQRASTCSALENANTSNVTLDHLQRIADALKVDVAELLRAD